MQDLTKITTPFGLLDEATQKALEAHGGPYEIFGHSGKWKCVNPSTWVDELTYRVRPEPPRPLVVHDWSVFEDRWNYIVRDSYGVFLCEDKPEVSVYNWRIHGNNTRCRGLSEKIVDPGTCDWTEAIAERPKEEKDTKDVWDKWTLLLEWYNWLDENADERGMRLFDNFYKMHTGKERGEN